MYVWHDGWWLCSGQACNTLCTPYYKVFVKLAKPPWDLKGHAMRRPLLLSPYVQIAHQRALTFLPRGCLVESGLYLKQILYKMHHALECQNNCVPHTFKPGKDETVSDDDGKINDEGTDLTKKSLKTVKKYQVPHFIAKHMNPYQRAMLPVALWKKSYGQRLSSLDKSLLQKFVKFKGSSSVQLPHPSPGIGPIATKYKLQRKFGRGFTKNPKGQWNGCFPLINLKANKSQGKELLSLFSDQILQRNFISKDRSLMPSILKTSFISKPKLPKLKSDFLTKI